MSYVGNQAREWRLLESVQSTLAASSMYGATLWIHSLLTPGLIWSGYLICGALVAVGSVLYNLANSRHYREPLGMVTRHDTQAALGQTFCISFILLAYFVATNGEHLSRGFLFSYTPLLFVTLVLSRRWTVKYLSPLVLENRHRCGAVVVGGTAERADQLAAWIESKSSIGLQSLGWVSTEKQTDAVVSKLEAPTLPVLGDIHNLESILQKTKAAVVIVADFVNSGVNLGALRSTCDRCGVKLAFNVDFGDAVPFGISTYQENGLHLVALRDQTLVNDYQRLLKRGFDVAISLPVVLLVLPALVILFRSLHKLQAPGPLMVKQKRLGLHGRQFTIYKFRTTYCESRGEASFANHQVFPAGVWLRRLRLDVFPQFLNVLHGSMSLVGPRPEICQAEGELAAWSAPFRGRNFIKPGLTGLVQLSSLRITPLNTEEVIDRTKTDLYYVENWSLKMDATILARTLRRFAFRRRSKVPTGH